MLVLSRRVGERILIGDDIVLTVIDVRHDTVRLGIAAPRSVRVNRAEVHQAVAEANRDATQAAESAVAVARSLRRSADRAPTGPRGTADTPPGGPTASPAAPRDSSGDPGTAPTGDAS